MTTVNTTPSFLAGYHSHLLGIIAFESYNRTWISIELLTADFMFDRY